MEIDSKKEEKSIQLKCQKERSRKTMQYSEKDFNSFEEWNMGKVMI